MLRWLALLSIVTFVVSLVLVPIVVARMRADYFVADAAPPARRHPALRILVLVVKNVLGVAFLAAGIAMLVLPGQGILTLLVGLSLVGFPGKRAFERRLVSLGPVSRAIQWIRRRAGVPPLQIP